MEIAPGCQKPRTALRRRRERDVHYASDSSFLAWFRVLGFSANLLWARRGDGRSDGTARGHQPALGVVVVLDLHNVLALQLAELEHHCGAQLRVRPVPDSEVGEHRHDGLVVRAQKHQLLRLGGVLQPFKNTYPQLIWKSIGRRERTNGSTNAR